ncbi:aldo/keto reductase [Klebsiella pneumoniae subsp. pneumoniae]|uniref:aldo/keto reductase n=1 Tax=Klebsiella pneumoniae TaxID=573 RepID=UPI0021B17A55|nr:aldo/keto reductase [Klebsiella pneumoniae]MCT6795049.1 aldo/keto reductase [Klebsiella pneumoniae subsp. pneumoniae]
MEYSLLGHSGLKVSRLALGCMSFGDSDKGAHAWTLDYKESEKIICKALDLGINFFDTANIYSLGSSEETLGRCLKKHVNRSNVIIATKVYEKMDDSPVSGGLSRREIFTQIDNSLRRLQSEYIDLYIIHRWDYNTPIEETMEALHDLIKIGKIRYIGASSMHAWQFVKAQYTATIHGWNRFISMQNHYNLINREDEREMIPYCCAEGVGVTPWSPLARGKLAKSVVTKRSQTDKVISWLYESAKKSDDDIIISLNKLSVERGYTNAQIALSWLLGKSGIVSPIIGATSIEQLIDNAKCVEIKLEPSEVYELERHYTPHLAPEYI